MIDKEEKQKKLKEEKVWVASPVRNLILRHLSNWAVLTDGRGYTHLSKAISLLRAVVGEERIQKHFGEKYQSIDNLLIEFSRRVNYISHYFEFLEDKDYRDSSVFNEHYRNYLQALQYFPVIHKELLELLNFLINETELHDKNIPSIYLVASSKEQIDFSLKDEEELKSHRRKFTPEVKEENLEDKEEDEDS